MAIVRPFEVCTREEVMYLLDLVREHAGHVRLGYKEDPDGEIRIVLAADSPELSRYLAYMLDRERARTRRRKSRVTRS